jgi:hypothetical protein
VQARALPSAGARSASSGSACPALRGCAQPGAEGRAQLDLVALQNHRRRQRAQLGAPGGHVEGRDVGGAEGLEGAPYALLRAPPELARQVVHQLAVAAHRGRLEGELRHER